jgi:hypothetical protein
MTAIDRHEDIEAALRGELAARAGALAVGDPPHLAVDRAIRRARNRRRAGAVSGLVLAIALAASLPAVLGGSGSPAIGAAKGTPSPLLTLPLRGNLAGDSSFIAAVQWRLDTTASIRELPAIGGKTNGKLNTVKGALKVLYANDDGTNRVVIAGAYLDDGYTYFIALVGRHGDAPSALTQQDLGGMKEAVDTFTYLGEFSPSRGTIPFVVLGPTSMTQVEYSTGLHLEVQGSRLVSVRTDVTRAAAVDGAAAGEIANVNTVTSAAWLNQFATFRGQINGKYVDADPNMRGDIPAAGDSPLGAPFEAVKVAVAQKGRAAGLTMPTSSPGGDAVPDNVAQVLLDLANYSSLPISSISYQVDWIGRETADWDAALLDVKAPGLPDMQIFVRGLTAGAPDSASPGLGQTFVRPSAPLAPGHLPKTASAFGGTPEPGVFGYELMTAW